MTTTILYILIIILSFGGGFVSAWLLQALRFQKGKYEEAIHETLSHHHSGDLPPILRDAEGNVKSTNDFLDSLNNTYKLGL